MVFKHHEIKHSIDIFFWVKHNGYWWHTYDYYNENKKRPSTYVFKGTPEKAFKGDPYSYPWIEIAPPLNFPALYGTLLDNWYPGKKDEKGNLIKPPWFVPDTSYGQSQGKIVKLKDCHDLNRKLK